MQLNGAISVVSRNNTIPFNMLPFFNCPAVSAGVFPGIAKNCACSFPRKYLNIL